MKKEVKQIFADLVCLHDKVHTYHIRTVNMVGCATLHGTLGDIYTGLEDLTDKFGENVIQKFYGEQIPSAGECYEMSDMTDNGATFACEILDDVVEEIDELMNDI